MTPSSKKRFELPRVPWWGRLESRVITALVVLGVLCVGASGYVVTMTVRYFDGIVDDAMATNVRAVDLAAPFYDEFVRARKQTYRSRVSAMARELELLAARRAGDTRQTLLEELFNRERDLVEIRLSSAAGNDLVYERKDSFPEDDGAWIWVPGGQTELLLADKTGTEATATLQAVFALDPGMDRRYQSLGRLKREAALVTVGGDRVDRDELGAAVVRAIGVASALVLMVAFIAGFILARATTRKVSDLSVVMRKVASGDFGARVGNLGNDELGQLGAAFNRMLDELEAARKKLSYLQRVGAWQEMARRIAHEIKNPLTPIQLAVQQLREKDPKHDPAFSRMLATSVEIVEDEVAALRRMVTSFSRFAKVPEAQLQPVTVERIFAEFDRAYGHLTERESDKLEVVVPPPEVAVMGDRQLLKQCLVNLVENAVLSAREAKTAEVCVRVRTAVVADRVEIWVEDNGPGIAPERRERVFEPYESTRKQGSGLGLAITKKIVLDHAGEVRVDQSELGGAALVLALPLITPSAVVEDA